MIMQIVNSSGQWVMQIEGPIFPRKDVKADYMGYWLEMPDGEGQLLHADCFAEEMLKLYKKTF